MEITSLPQMEKPETPSLCPLTTKGCGVQLLFYQKDNKPVVITCRYRGKQNKKKTQKKWTNRYDSFAHFLKSQIRKVLSSELETSKWLSGAANCKKKRYLKMRRKAILVLEIYIRFGRTKSLIHHCHVSVMSSPGGNNTTFPQVK